MDELRKEFTIGANRFDLLNLDWDPNWWILVDVRPEDGWWDWEDLLSRDSIFVFREHDRYLIEPYGYDNILFIESCIHADDNESWEWHLPKPCMRGGAASIALQLSVLLKKDPIYLVGCDLYQYRGPTDSDINHFHPKYCPYKVRKSTGEELIGPEEWEQLNHRLIRAHEMARKSSPSTIYNATVGGALNVYNRVDIHAVLNGKE